MELRTAVVLSSLLASACGGGVAHDEALSPDGGAPDRHAALLARDAQFWCEKQSECGWPDSVTDCVEERRAWQSKCMQPDDDIAACLDEFRDTDCRTLEMTQAASCLFATKSKSTDGC